ncbi:MAG: hypothetical protein LLF76_01040 [Planctomycetaceae bacterium]|nr:hypothetical protein [Planctomycetaceae bacterium]
MALTSRERIAMILAIIAIALLVADRYVLDPLLQKRSENKQAGQSMAAELEHGRSVLQRRKQLKVRWDQMQQNGLSAQAGATESAVLRFLQESSKETGLLLTAIQPEYAQIKADFGHIDFFVSGSGDMRGVTRFLWDLETAPLPLKIKSFQLGASDDNASQMALQLTLSSIYMVEGSGSAGGVEK